MACEKCREFSEKGKKFCGSCGSRLEAAPVSPSPQISPAPPASASPPPAKDPFDAGLSALENAFADSTEKINTPDEIELPSLSVSDLPQKSPEPSPRSKPAVSSRNTQKTVTQPAEKKAVSMIIEDFPDPEDDEDQSLPEKITRQDREPPEKKPDSASSEKPKSKSVRPEKKASSAPAQQTKKPDPPVTPDEPSSAESVPSEPAKTTDVGTSAKSSEMNFAMIKGYLEKSIAVYKSEPNACASWAGVFLVLMSIFVMMPAMFIGFILPAVVSAFICNLIFFILAPLFTSGFYHYFHHVNNYLDAGFQDFQLGKELAKPLLISGFVCGVPIAFGNILLTIPGVIASSLWCFTTLLILDRKMEYWQAMQCSQKMVLKNLKGFLILNGFLFAVNLLNFLVIPVLFTAPVTLMIIYFAYEDVFGFESTDFSA